MAAATKYCNSPDPVEFRFNEPQVAIGPGGDFARPCASADAEFGDHTLRGNPPDPVAVKFREPQVAVRAGGNPGRASGDAGAKLRDHPRWRNPPDPAKAFREPNVAIGAGGDAGNLCTGVEPGDPALRGNPPDPVAATFREP